MTRVDFYVLGSNGDGKRNREYMSCRLIEKAWTSGYTVFVHTDSLATAEHLDELLWTFRDDSFVPHALCLSKERPSSSIESPVLVGAGEVPNGAGDVLINLTENVPLEYTQFSRVAEFVDTTESSRAASRQRFRYYRDHRCEVHTHHL